MENISNELIGYIALAAGVVVGWALCWVWGRARDRRCKNKSINLSIQTHEIVDAEYVDGKFRLMEKK